MYYSKIEITNFMPYSGNSSIDLTVKKDAPIILIQGENNRGKSSFFNAIRWALYGEAIGRTGNIIPDETLMNDAMWRNGEREFSVTLHFRDAEDLYILTRKILFDNDQESRKIKNKIVFLQKNSSVVPKQEIDPMINLLMTKKISVFFLCDMEVLSEYENLVVDGNKEAFKVKQSIEDILGVPALILIRDDLRILLANAEKEQSKLTSQNKEVKKASEDIISLEKKKREETDQKEKAKRDIARKQVELEKIKNDLTKHAEATSSMQEEDLLVKQNNEDIERNNARRVELKKVLREIWWIPLAPRIQQSLDETESKQQIAASRNEQMNGLRIIKQQLSASSESSKCHECGQNLNENQKKDHLARIKKIDKEIDTLSEPFVPSLEELVIASSKLKPFAIPPTAGKIQPIESEIRITASEIRKRSNRIQEIRKRLQGINRADINLLNMNRTNLEREVGVAQVTINKSTQELEEIEKELTSARKKLAKVPGEHIAQESEIEFATLGELTELFDLAVDRFRDQLKLKVENKASEIFQNLVSDNAFKSLRINDNYGLKIMNNFGSIIDHRGAGVEQIVALSLILALGKSAVRSGTLVLDTPFGRLDETHRKNILSWLPVECEQVILLMQSGESVTEESRKQVSSKISREYVIQMVNESPDQSEIKVFSEAG
jgi:DNA sulfur modification protein DndD